MLERGIFVPVIARHEQFVVNITTSVIDVVLSPVRISGINCRWSWENTTRTWATISLKDCLKCICSIDERNWALRLVVKGVNLTFYLLTNIKSWWCTCNAMHVHHWERSKILHDTSRYHSPLSNTSQILNPLPQWVTYLKDNPLHKMYSTT